MIKKTLLLGISAGIAAYKSPELVRRLKDHAWDVHVVLTPSAHQFVAPLSLHAVSQNMVYSELFSLEQESKISHIQLADLPDLILIAPATADLIAKYAHGLCNDLLSTILMATTKKVILCPSMNTNMWNHPATQGNIELLKSRGVIIFEPGSGSLACGYEGAGRLPEIADIVSFINSQYTSKLLVNRKVLITAGPTREFIDPVRYISSPSSGKMGYALAQEAQNRGAEVYLVSGPTSLPIPAGVEYIQIGTAQEMFEAVEKLADKMDISICCAAVSDFRPTQIQNKKEKKDKAELKIELTKNPDILAYLGEHKKEKQILIGFAAETDNVEEYARQKLEKKNLDFICANDVSKTNIGFASNDNAISLIFKNSKIELGVQSKTKIAQLILDEIEKITTKS